MDEAFRNRRRKVFLEGKQRLFSRQSRRRVSLLYGALILLTGLLLLAEFEPCWIPKSMFTLRECTLTSIYYRQSMRGGEDRSVFCDASGQQYELTASREDYIGREVSLYTRNSHAVRKQYEMPRSLLLQAEALLVIVMFLGLGILYIVKYLEYKKYFEPLIAQGEIKKEK